jgi:hypothetical protein
MSWIFVWNRDGGCRAGPRQTTGVPRINVDRHGRTPQSAAGTAAREFFASNARYLQVETTVDEDRISV